MKKFQFYNKYNKDLIISLKANSEISAVLLLSAIVKIPNDFKLK